MIEFAPEAKAPSQAAPARAAAPVRRVSARPTAQVRPARAVAVPARAVAVGGVQARLTVGAVADPYEREADRMADHVVKLLRRMPAAGAEGGDGEAGDHAGDQAGASRIQRRSSASAPASHRCGPGCVQRHSGHHHETTPEPGLVEDQARMVPSRISRAAAIPAIRTAPSSHRCGAGCVQRHAGHDHDHPEVGAGGGELGSELTGRIRRSAGSGAALHESVRAPMETAFGADFSGVRIHTNSDVAPRIGASAFTSGADIHFAPGEFHPGDQSGQWLLSHELTHVVQQTGAEAPGAVHRHTTGCIQRHASKEHYMLGSMTPEQIKAIADAKGKVDAAVEASSGFMNLFNSMKMPPAKELEEGLTSVQEQLVGLDNWKSATLRRPDPSGIVKGDTSYNHEWGGQLVTVQCLDGEIACTVGELNAIPDFFGSYDDLAKVDRTVVFRTLQVIRRESYMYLKSLEAQLQGKKYSYDKKKEGFSGLAGNNISVPGIGPKATDDVADLLDTESMLKGKKGEVGTDEGSSATATLGRNACHFPPESWLRWREFHTQARSLIDSASRSEQLGGLANKAIGINAFGEHYLQDSFAAGHLINKGFVMAVAMEHMSAGTKLIRGVTDAHVQALQTATAHKEAYALPDAAKAKVDAKANGNAEPQNAMDDATLKARDPQSALDAAKTKKAEGAGPGAIKKAEMQTIGLAPYAMSFEQYRLWLNDFWLQKITNTLHDKYCVQGLSVASPDNPDIFKIYGDSNMMRSSEGAAYTAATSQMSRGAINALVENKRQALSAAEAGGPVQKPTHVPSIEDIVARFPNRVIDDDGTPMSLETWATGDPMRKKIAAVVASFTGDFITGAVRAVSTVKQVSKGLGPDHGAF